MRLLKNEISL